MKSISAIHPAYGEYTRETRAQGLIIATPISQYIFYSALFCPLHSNISKEQHENYPSSHYRKYREYARETRTPYLDT